jgi:ATP diphosphatase
MEDREQALREIDRLVAIMARLRGADGCPWDRAQDFASIAPYTLEEAHEVADAIARGDMAELCEELGDLLLQVVFHARMAAEAGHFTLADVARGINHKMERRHPHIFGPDAGTTDVEAVRATWEEIKAREKPRQSALDGIALALPALTRANKLASRAARTGFDWPDAEGPLAKIHEELAEIRSAPDEAARAEEAGDLLFAAASYLRKLGIDPEAALRAANAKFESRFRRIEAEPGFAGLSLDAKEALWQAEKNGNRS